MGTLGFIFAHPPEDWKKKNVDNCFVVAAFPRATHAPHSHVEALVPSVVGVVAAKVIDTRAAAIE